MKKPNEWGPHGERALFVPTVHSFTTSCMRYMQDRNSNDTITN